MDDVAPSVTNHPVTGVIPILVTPFGEHGRIDHTALARQAQFLADVGAQWVGIGFGSEVHRLAQPEVIELVHTVLESSGGRLAVLGNADVPSEQAGAVAVRQLADAGADAAMLRPSSLAGTPQQALIEMFRNVAADGGLPVVVQDAPQHTGVELSPASLATLLADAPGVVAVKVEPPAPAPKMSAIVAELDGHHGIILGGLGGADFVHELDRGSAGTMPGPAFPEVFLAVSHLHAQGQRRYAVQLLGRVLPLLMLANRSFEAFLYQQKHVLRRRGVLDSARLRQPHPPIDAHLTAEIDSLLEIIDLGGTVKAARESLGRTDADRCAQS